jgi:O-antigen/teichoic acid export membrane protein
VLGVYQTRLGGIVHSRFRRNVVTTGAVGVAVYGLGLATGPILARSLGPSGRGDLAAVLVPAQLLCFGLAFGLPSAAAYLVHWFDRGTLLATSTVFGLVVGIPLVLVVWPLLPGYYQHHGTATLFWAQIFLASAPFSVGAAVALSLLWADGASLRWNIWRSAPAALTALLTLGLFITSRLTVWTGLAAGFVGACSTAPLLVQKTFAWWPLQVRFNALRAQLSYGARVAIGSAADTVAGRLDQALMVAMVPSADLGLYAVAVTAAGLSGPLTSSLGLALFPELRRENSADAQRRRTGRALAAVLVSSTGVAAVLALAGPWLLAFLFGKSFTDAATPLRLLLLGQIANDATGPFTARLLAAGRPGAASQASAAAAVVTVVGLALLVPSFGISGAAVTTTISYLVKFSYIAIAVRRCPSTATITLPKDAPSLGGRP